MNFKEWLFNEMQYINAQDAGVGSFFQYDTGGVNGHHAGGEVVAIDFRLEVLHLNNLINSRWYAIIPQSINLDSGPIELGRSNGKYIVVNNRIRNKTEYVMVTNELAKAAQEQIWKEITQTHPEIARLSNTHQKEELAKILQQFNSPIAASKSGETNSWLKELAKKYNLPIQLAQYYRKPLYYKLPDYWLSRAVVTVKYSNQYTTIDFSNRVAQTQTAVA